MTTEPNGTGSGYTVLVKPSDHGSGLGVFECQSCGDHSNDPNIAANCCEGYL